MSTISAHPTNSYGALHEQRCVDWWGVKIIPATIPLPEGEETAETSTEEEKWLRCAACGARLTPSHSRIEVNGAHEHAFMNPSGLRFTVACFATAPGCMPDGDPSAVWTWFPGHAWQIALCKACGVHVGWSFQAIASESTSTFHGLVRDRLV